MTPRTHILSAAAVLAVGIAFTALTMHQREPQPQPLAFMRAGVASTDYREVLP